MSKNNAARLLRNQSQHNENTRAANVPPVPPSEDFPRPKPERGGASGNTRGFLRNLTDPILGIGAVIRELSPRGLAGHGIPFTQMLKMPYSVVISSVIVNLAGLALPLVILQVYDRVIPNEAI